LQCRVAEEQGPKAKRGRRITANPALGNGIQRRVSREQYSLRRNVNLRKAA
jgi:hypothetical protein